MDELRILAAAREQQCQLCLNPVRVGDQIVAIGPDLLSGHNIWVHEPCGRSWLELHPGKPALLSTGWEVITSAQKCPWCHNQVSPGKRVFWVTNQSGSYDRVCQLCWMRRNLS